MEIQELAAKLRQDGIAKGQEEAKKIVDEAKLEAQKIIDDANKEKDEILKKANQESESILENGKQNLRLTARDLMLKLKEDITSILQDIVKQTADKALKKEEILKELILNLIKVHSKGEGTNIEIPKGLNENFKEWLKQEINGNIKEKKEIKGFKLQDKDGGQIEVTSQSVQESLLPLVSGLVKDIIQQKQD